MFRVTDAPEIHSNGFHIKFDASKGPNGYILPEWIEEKEQEEIGEEKEQILSDVLKHQWVRKKSWNTVNYSTLSTTLIKTPIPQL